MLDYDIGADNIHVGPSDRTVAARPQVGLHPHGGLVVR